MSRAEQDFEDARRGFIAALEPGRIEAPDGRVVWDTDAYAFLGGECPETANPSLWRQGRLTAIQGLFEIAPGFFQVRGLDLSNMEIIEGDEGIVVIDPLISVECAAAGAGALPRAPWRPAGDRRRLHPQPRRPFRRRRRASSSAEDVERGASADPRARGLPRARGERERYAGTAMARRAGYMYGRCSSAARAGRSAPASG